MMEKPFFALDIGTTSIKALIAQRKGDLWDILGFGFHPSEGIKKSSINQIDKTSSCVKYALEEAQLMAGCQLDKIVMNIAGNQVESINSKGIVPIREGIVSKNDMRQALEAAQAIALPAHQKILHVIPQRYSIDHHHAIADPMFMSGTRLEVDAHIVTTCMNAASNVLQVVTRAGFEAQEMVFDNLATAAGVLTADEKELGVAIVDIGGGTTKMTLFQKGAPLYSFVLPLGGDQVTSDLALALRTTIDAAQAIKLRYGSVGPVFHQAEAHALLAVPSLGTRHTHQIQKSQVPLVLTPRLKEILLLLDEQLMQRTLKSFIPCGVVITGGTAKLEGLIPLAQDVFHLPVRLGTPQLIQNVNDLLESPQCACVFGLIEWAYRSRQQQEEKQVSWRDLVQKIRYWLAS